MTFRLGGTTNTICDPVGGYLGKESVWSNMAVAKESTGVRVRERGIGNSNMWPQCAGQYQ